MLIQRDTDGEEVMAGEIMAETIIDLSTGRPLLEYRPFLNTIFQTIFWPMTLFAGHPGRVVFMAALFWVGFALSFRQSKFPSSSMFIAGFAWSAYAGWEFYCSMKSFDIRIDLLFVAPFIYLATLAALAEAIAPFFRKRGTGHQS